MKIIENKTKGKIRKILCLLCKHETKHVVISSIEKSGSEYLGDEASYQWETTYEIIKCRGCDEISFRQSFYDSESYEDDGTYYSTETIFPRRSSDSINIKSHQNLPNNINRLYQETINCYNNDILTLCCWCKGFSGGNLS